MPLLEARALSVRSEGVSPLPGPIDLAVEAGEVLVVEGPSGAGKTTLLRALALLEARSTGEVRFRGEPVSDADVPRFRRLVAYVAQKTAVSTATVEATLRAPFSFRTAEGAAFDPDRARALVSRLRLPADVLSRRLSDLSVGEAQRVGLVRALLVEPTVLLLDEPTSALDPVARDAAEALLREWMRRDARAVVLVSHDAPQAERLADRRLALEEGRLARIP